MIRLNLLPKICNKCSVEKMPKQFGIQRSQRAGRRGFCRICSKTYHKNLYNDNPENYKLIGRRCYRKRLSAYLQYKYGISTAQYSKILEDQNGVCAICLQPPCDDKRLCVDHNHMNGRVRALLCMPCNCIVGLAHEDSNILSRASAYVTEHNEIDIDWDVDNLKRKLEACGI